VIALRAQRVLADGVERHGWWVTVGDGVVHEVGEAPSAGAALLDLGAVDLVPGIVDLHADCLTEKSFPRPSTEVPVANAILELDLEAVAHGITTPFVSLCLEDDVTRHRSMARAREVAAAYELVRPELLADHRFHLRVEVTGAGAPVARELAAAGGVGLVSYMDHTPGQGQFADEAIWRSYYGRSDGIGDVELSARLEARLAAAPRAAAVRAELAAIAAEHGAALASHDDDSPAAVERALELGARIAEFPITLEAAKLAHAHGIGVVMGAPNARRGRSHLANLSAREALAEGCLDALASDYHLPSLLAATYALVADGACSWAEAVRLVSERPAQLAGLDDRGRITPGMRADLVALVPGSIPLVAATWVAGELVFQRGPLGRARDRAADAVALA
jgi:alpha-D-ribose 1-methylphosphonate 5-triphosphate diphosphatase